MPGQRNSTLPRTDRKATKCRWSCSRKYQKGPAERGPSRRSEFFFGFLDSGYVLGLQSLRSLLHLELYLRAFVQGTIPVCLDGRKVYEHVIAATSLDETIALGGVKPFHNAFFFHYSSPDSLFVSGSKKEKATSRSS